MSAMANTMGWPNWLVMWVLAIAVYAGCKLLTWWRAPSTGARRWRHVGYLFAWPGMDAAAFLRSAHTVARPSLGEWETGWRNLLLGVLLIWGVAGWVPESADLLRGWIGMAGLVLLLHFGVFRLLSCAWRVAGVAAEPLMDRPLHSKSVSEFWGRRWNMAFRDLTHRFLFRPLSRRFGPRPALLLGFVGSGLVHDLVISVPAGGGYGWPTLYFTLQAVAIFLERSRLGKALGLGRGQVGWLFAMLVVGLPAFVLFHPPFVHNVFIPFLDALRLG